jgi:hypothetical protein
MGLLEGITGLEGLPMPKEERSLQAKFIWIDAIMQNN